jgi:hypothetical protein
MINMTENTMNMEYNVGKQYYMINLVPADGGSVRFGRLVYPRVKYEAEATKLRQKEAGEARRGQAGAPRSDYSSMCCSASTVI